MGKAVDEKTVQFLEAIQKHKKPIIWGSIGSGVLLGAAIAAMIQQGTNNNSIPGSQHGMKS